MWCSDLLSPRAWGWSDIQRRTESNGKVIPTRVGMVRDFIQWRHDSWGYPHARGDGPVTHRPQRSRRELSPRAWGWSALPYTRASPDNVIPTRVGMVRVENKSKDGWSRYPHARGDGPEAKPEPVVLGRLSPRAWGWSVLPSLDMQRTIVIPTRVGMVRARRLGVGNRPRYPHARGDGPRSVIARNSSCGLSPRAWGWSVYR